MSSLERHTQGKINDGDASKTTAVESESSSVDQPMGACRCGNIHKGPLQAFGDSSTINNNDPISKPGELKQHPEKSGAQASHSESVEASKLQTSWSQDCKRLRWMWRKGEVICALGSFNILLLITVAMYTAAGWKNFVHLLPWLVTVVSSSVLFYSLLVDYAGSQTACHYVSPMLFLMTFFSWLIPKTFCQSNASNDNWCKSGADLEPLGFLFSICLPWLLTAAPLMDWTASCLLSLVIPCFFFFPVFKQTGANTTVTAMAIDAPVIVVMVGISNVCFGYLRSCADIELVALTDRWKTAFLESKSNEEQAYKHLEDKEKGNADRITKMRQFISYIFHEIRVPFNAVVLGIGHLLAMNVSDEQREILKMMDSSSSSMIRILNDVLDMGKIEAGKLQLEKQPFNMGELVSSLIWAFKDTLESKGIDFSLCLDPGTKKLLSNYNLLGDKHRVQQVLANYLSNATKFTPRGGKVCLRIVCNGTFMTDSDVSRGQPLLSCSSSLDGEVLLDSVHSSPGDGIQGSISTVRKHTAAKVTISVEDTGIGISKEDQARLFEPYMQISAGASQGGGGTGLGLSFAKKIVEMTGGNIAVFSEVGKGSVFLFTMPFLLVEDCKDGNRNTFQYPFDTLSGPVGSFSRNLTSGLPSGCRSTGRKPKILIVEDNQVNRRILRKLLTSLNIDSDDAEDGKQAVDLCRNGGVYDMILIDKEMPIMDGHEATRELRAMGIKAPIVGLTGNALDSDRNQFLAAGVDDFFTKPVSRHQLVKLLEAHALIAHTRDKESPVNVPVPSVTGSLKGNVLADGNQG
eukprot:c24019_g1_i1 orf=61-2463(+)